MPEENKDGDENSAEGDEAKNSGALAAIQNTINSLPETISKALGKGFESIKPAEPPQDDDDNDEDDEPPTNDVDLEELDRKQLVQHVHDSIMNGVKKELSAHNKTMNEEITSTKQVVNQEQVKTEIKEAREKHDDLDEFREDIATLAKQHQSLSVEELYFLAKSKNPDKVEKLETARNEEKAEEEKKKPKFGGLTPTSSFETSNKGKMDKKEAIDTAWDETMGEVHSSFIGN